MKFSEYYDMKEALYRDKGTSTFNFLNKDKLDSGEPALNPSNTRMNNRFAAYDQRVEYGKSIEKQIFDSLVKCGLKLKEPTASQDMYEKIDAFWLKDGKEEPMQIKYRDSGRDVLFEVMKDYTRNIPGRDMVGKAKFYAVLPKGATYISIVEVAEAKKLINAALDIVKKNGFDKQNEYKNNYLTLKVRPDPRTGISKLMAYIPLISLKNVVSSCKATVNF